MTEFFSPQLKKAVNRCGIKELIKNIIKSIVFYVLFYFILFIAEQRNDIFTRETQPFWFWFVFVVILIIPFWVFKFYKLILEPSFYGTVINVENSRILDGKESDAPRLAFQGGDIQRFGEIEICILTVKSSVGIEHKYTFKRENATFAREYYSVGDVVYHNVFAKYPVNSIKAPPKKFCLRCGDLAADFENKCPLCRIPLVENKIK